MGLQLSNLCISYLDTKFENFCTAGIGKKGSCCFGGAYAYSKSRVSIRQLPADNFSNSFSHFYSNGSVTQGNETYDDSLRRWTMRICKLRSGLLPAVLTGMLHLYWKSVKKYRFANHMNYLVVEPETL